MGIFQEGKGILTGEGFKSGKRKSHLKVGGLCRCFRPMIQTAMFAPPHYPVHLRIPPFYKFRGKLSLHSYSHYRFHFYILLNNL
jgi:hypothetical protein